jgi:hypothetical protein
MSSTRGETTAFVTRRLAIDAVVGLVVSAAAPRVGTDSFSHAVERLAACLGNRPVGRDGEGQRRYSRVIAEGGATRAGR